MNQFSDETLMAFADDQLDPTMRAAGAAAMRDDPAIDRRIVRHRALRARIRLAYSAELQQQPLQRSASRVRGQGAKRKATVTDLASVRAATTAIVTTPKAGPRPGWRPAAALAASLLIGVAVGYFALHRAGPVVADHGVWVASGGLAGALSRQLSDEHPAGAAVQMGSSFVSKADEYCRVFSLAGAGAGGGLACRHQDAWRIRVLAQDGAEPLAAVQSQIVGAPLDHDGEIKARDHDWRFNRIDSPRQ